MLSIGFDAKRAFNNNSGLGNYSRAMIHILSKYYPENLYTLFTPRKDKRFADIFVKQSNIQIEMPKSFWKVTPSLWRSYHLAKLASVENNIFHGLSHELPFGIEKTKSKTVVTIHDLIAWRNPEYFSKVDRKIYQRKQAHACRIADIIIAVSQQTKQDLIEILNVNPNKICVVYQPCDSQFYKIVSEEESVNCADKYHLPARFILSVGTIEARKNLLTTLKALSSIPDDIALVAIGRKTEYAEIIEKEAEKLHLSDRLFLIDNADFADFPAIYSQSSLFVYPSFYEGFGIPVLEAMACGVPVITSNRSSLPEVGGDAALYIDPIDNEMLAQQINLILQDDSLKREMIRKGHLQAEKFSEKEIAAALWHIYRKM